MTKHNWYEAKEGRAEHLVYLDNKAKELEKLLTNKKTMIIRGAAAKKSPLGGRAKENDLAYFVEKGGDMIVSHRGVITEVIEKYKMTPEESEHFIKEYETELNLSEEQKKRWYGKKCIGLYKIEFIEEITSFKYKREKNMDDWIITEDINDVKE